MGFEALSKDLGIPNKSLMRMLGPSGNPQASNLLAIIGALQRHAGIELHLAELPPPKKARTKTRKAVRAPRPEEVRYPESSSAAHGALREAGRSFQETVRTMRVAIGLSMLLAATPVAMAASVSPRIDDLAEIYKSRFQNGDVDGGKYQSEDVLEIVKTGPGQAYIRAHLEFFNGHSCAIHCIARLEGAALVYRPHDPGNGCVLTLKKDGNRVVFSDAGNACKTQYCGERGAFDGAAFDYAGRRDIRYMARLLASREYAQKR